MHIEPDFIKEQLEFFAQNGYLIVRSLATTNEVNAIRAATERDLKAEIEPLEFEAEVQYPGSPESIEAPGGRTVRRLKSVYGRDRSIDEWAASARVTERMRQLLATDKLMLVRSHHNSIMTKHPRYSSHTGWHQDVRYWNYDTIEFVNAWLALGHEEQANGGMQLIPGTHRMQFNAERYDAAKFLREDILENKALIDQAVLAELEAGDVLFFHANLFHMAGRNFTQNVKYALVLSYRCHSNHPKPGTSSTTLDDIAV